MTETVKRYSSRKYTTMMVIFVVASILLWFGKLTESAYVTVVIFDFGSYFAANGFETYLANKNVRAS